jgi:AraC-like DNA-binding protein
VLNGQKRWNTRFQEALVRKGDCLFVRKGAHSVFQYFDRDFCALVIFVPDDFIRSVILENKIDLGNTKRLEDRDSLFLLKPDNILALYFQSFLSYLSEKNKPEIKLMELKFRELILVAASQNYNASLVGYFARLCDTGKPSLLEVMENNFCYPMGLEDYASLAGRSLSVFKADFKKTYNRSPGKWLKKKRLNYSKYLLKSTNMAVAEIVHDSGFQNRSHFSRAFKNEFGCTPLAFRRSFLARY